MPFIILTMGLDSLTKNKSAIVEGFNNIDKAILKRLYDIGIRINSKITIVKKSRNGGVILEIDGRLIALSLELSKNVLVKVGNEV